MQPRSGRRRNAPVQLPQTPYAIAGSLAGWLGFTEEVFQSSAQAGGGANRAVGNHGERQEGGQAGTAQVASQGVALSSAPLLEGGATACGIPLQAVAPRGGPTHLRWPARRACR